MWDEMDIRLRRVKKKPDLAFGGCKMILAGDFGQLPPVVTGKDEKELTALGYSAPWDFTVSKVFGEES